MPAKSSKRRTALPKRRTALPRRTQTARQMVRTVTARRGVRSSQVGPGSGVISTFAPSAFGSVVPQSTFRYAGPAQQLADQDSRGSLRVIGTDLYSIPVSTAIAGTGAFFTSVIGPFYSALTPATISARVQAVEEMFQWYAIRKLRISYIPSCPSTTAFSLAFGIVTDPRILTAIPSPTEQQVLEMQPASMSTAWQPQSFMFIHTGTKLWECYLSSESLDTRVQAYIAGVTSTAVAGNTGFGNLFVEYEIDFYQPTPLLSSVDFKARDLFCRRCSRGSAGAPSHPPIMHTKYISETKTPIRSSLPDDDNHSIVAPRVRAIIDDAGVARREVDDDWTVPSPPSYVPAVSTVPGSPAYVPSPKPKAASNKSSR
jgi:hypothetical protein